MGRCGKDGVKREKVPCSPGRRQPTQTGKIRRGRPPLPIEKRKQNRKESCKKYNKKLKLRPKLLEDYVNSLAAIIHNLNNLLYYVKLQYPNTKISHFHHIPQPQEHFPMNFNDNGSMQNGSTSECLLSPRRDNGEICDGFNDVFSTDEDSNFISNTTSNSSFTTQSTTSMPFIQEHYAGSYNSMEDEDHEKNGNCSNLNEMRENGCQTLKNIVVILDNTAKLFTKLTISAPNDTSSA